MPCCAAMLRNDACVQALSGDSATLTNIAMQAGQHASQVQRNKGCGRGCRHCWPKALQGKTFRNVNIWPN
eukprot:scaffold198802_cov15-Tisochrysis_lutea.AAC.2